MNPNVDYCNNFIPPSDCHVVQLDDCYEKWNKELHNKYGFGDITAEIQPQDLCDFYYIYNKWPDTSRFFVDIWKKKIERATNKSNITSEVSI